MAKLTRRRRPKSRASYNWLPENDRPVYLDELKLDGFRYPLEQGRMFKCNTQTTLDGRGWWKVLNIEEWPDGRIEINAWWTSTNLKHPRMRAQHRACRPSQVKHITKEVRNK